jgi:hypothetical protein
MCKRHGIMSMGIALIILLFSLIAAMVLTNISSNLYKNIVKLGEGREIQYRKIVVQSLYNAFEIVDLTSLSPGETKSYSFTFQTNEQVTPLTFPATAVFIEQVDSNYFVKLYTREPSKEDMYGIIAQYLK